MSSYKHLGSVLDPSGSGAPDVPNRVQAAGAAYSPIARKVFGCNAISRAARLHLYFSLVISRLSYNVHVWSVIKQAMYTSLNATYMRGLRRIADCCRFDSRDGQLSDAAVRESLGVPSLQCLLLRKRLLLAANIARHGPLHLGALLGLRERGTPSPGYPC